MFVPLNVHIHDLEMQYVVPLNVHIHDLEMQYVRPFKCAHT